MPPVSIIMRCTLLSYSHKSFSYATLSIVVEPYSLRVLAADCLISKSSQQLKEFYADRWCILSAMSKLRFAVVPKHRGHISLSPHAQVCAPLA